MSLRSFQIPFSDYAENLRFSLKKARFSECIYCSIIFVLICALTYLSTHRHIVLVPYNLNRDVQVSVNQVSSQYLVSIGASDAALFFNYDPSNIKFQSDFFLSRVYPDSYGKTQTKIVARNREAIQNNVSQVFYPTKYFSDEKNKKLRIHGRLVSSISDKIVKSENIFLDITYYFVNGYAYIKEWMYHNEA